MSTTQIQISIPEQHEAAWRQQATTESASLTDWIAQCLQPNLPRTISARKSRKPRRKNTAAPDSKDSNETNRIDLKVPSDWIPAINTAAAKQFQRNRSAWIRWCCNAHLPKEISAELTEPKTGRPID